MMMMINTPTETETETAQDHHSIQDQFSELSENNSITTTTTTDVDKQAEELTTTATTTISQLEEQEITATTITTTTTTTLNSSLNDDNTVVVPSTSTTTTTTSDFQEEEEQSQPPPQQQQQQQQDIEDVVVDDDDDDHYLEEEEEEEELVQKSNHNNNRSSNSNNSSSSITDHVHHRTSTIGEEHEEEETEQERERRRREREEKEENEKRLRRARERKQVEMEILSTERDYVNNLDMCYQHFIKPIKESLSSGRPILNQDDYETMFVDLETIVPVNREMLKSLQAFFQREKENEERIQRGETIVVDPKADTLGTIFLRITPYLKSYTTFCNKYETIFKLIEERKSNKKVFRKFLESKEYQPEVNFQALVAFLIRPVQRIPRYNLLLRELIKNTEQDHPDLAKLNEANTNVVKLANYVNDKLKEAMNQEKCIFIENIVEGLNFELIQASRKFVKEGVLGYISSKHGIQSRYVFLFSDLFVTTKSKASIIEYQNNDSTGTNAPNFDHPDTSANSSSNSDLSTDAPDEERKRDSKSSKNKTKFFLRSAISLQHVPLVWVHDMPNGFVIQNAFQLVTPKKTYTFFAKDEQYKKEWLVSLNKQLDLLHANPLLQGKPKSEMTIPEDSKLHLFTCRKSLEDFKESTGDVSIEITAAAAVASNRDSGDAGNSPTITKLKISRSRRHSSVDRVESPKSPRGKKGFTTFLKNLTKKKERVKKITDGEIMVVSDSEDEEEESSRDMLPWMSDYYIRLLEKQTHNNFINVLGSLAEDMKPVISELQNIDEMDQIVINPLFGLKIKTTRDYRLSICDELRSKMDILHHPTLIPTTVHTKDSLHVKSKTQHSSLTYQDGSVDEFSEFVKSYKEKTGNASNIDSGETDSGGDTSGGTKEKRRRSLFFFSKKVFDQDSTQFEFYQDSCLDLVDSALQGYDATIFTYGQTGSGKTWTVLGRVGSMKAGEDILTPESGLFLRILSDLFKFKNQSTNIDVTIYVSILEIYLEEFRDLLADSKDKSKIVTLRETDNDVQMQNLTVESVNSIDEVYKLYKSAERNRIVSSTSMNDVSSRSHCTFLLDIVQKDKADPNNVLRSRICLVDLAGSERVKKSEVEGIHMKEAQAINKSLAALGNVVNGLYTDKKHIPFRDSKLTRILKPSFVGKGRVLLIANLSPTQSSSLESVSTLRFANRVKEMKTPTVSDDQIDNQKEFEFIELMKKNERLCAQANIAQKVFGYEFQFHNEFFIENQSNLIDSKIKEALKGYGSIIKKSQENEKSHKEHLLDSEIKKLTLEKSELWQSRVDEVQKRVEEKKSMIDAKNREFLEARRQFEISVKKEEELAKELEQLLDSKQKEYEDMNKTVQELLIRKVELENAVVEKHAIYKEKIEDHEREWKKEELLMTIETQKHEILRRLYDEVYALRTQQVAYVNAKKRFEERWKQRDEQLEVLTHYEMTIYIREAVTKLCEDAVDMSIQKSMSLADSQPVAFGNIPKVSIVDVMTQISPRSRASEKEIIPVQKPFTPISDEEIQAILQKGYPYDRHNILALVINYLKSGSVMRIHSKTRPSRRFLFTISEDLQNLCWKDDNFAEMEHVTVYTLPLYSIKAITLGQYSETFRTSSHLTQEDEFYFSFSLLHSTEKTIDLTCLNCFDFEGWVLGLGAILDLKPQWGKPLYSIGSLESVSLLNEQEKTLCQSSHISVQTYLSIKHLVEKLKQQNLPEITRGQMRVLSQLDIIRSDRIYAYLYRPVYTSSSEEQSP